jgi:predicted chitinase
MHDLQSSITARLQSQNSLPDSRLRHDRLRRTRTIPQFRRNFCRSRMAGLKQNEHQNHAKRSHGASCITGRSAFFTCGSAQLPVTSYS